MTHRSRTMQATGSPDACVSVRELLKGGKGKQAKRPCSATPALPPPWNAPHPRCPLETYHSRSATRSASTCCAHTTAAPGRATLDDYAPDYAPAQPTKAEAADRSATVSSSCSQVGDAAVPEAQADVRSDPGVESPSLPLSEPAAALSRGAAACARPGIADMLNRLAR